MAIADLIIRLRDNASPGIGRIGGALNGLTRQATQAAGGTGSLANAMTRGILQANAIQFAIGKATEAIGFMNSKFEEAKNLQLEQINAATSFSSLTGQSAEQAAQFIENLNSRLSISAAALPGATQDYKQLALAVQDNVIQAFKDPAGTLNQQGFEDTLASMSESFGALTAASTRDIGNTSLALSKALGGASVSELRNYAFFEQNGQILNEIERQLTAQGKELRDLSIQDRVKLIQEAGEKFITEDFKEQASNSVDGLLQSFNSMLFDPSAGIFGIMRDIVPNIEGNEATQGVQSAFTSINQALIELIGSDGILTRFTDLLKAAGVKFVDPMAVLKGAIDFAVTGLQGLNKGLGYVKDFVEAGGTVADAFRLGLSLLPTFDVKTIALDFMTSLGDRIWNFVNNAGSVITSLFNQGVATMSGGTADSTLAIITTAHGIGVAIGGLIGKFSGAVISFLSQVDYPALLVGIGRVAIGLIIGIGAALAGAIGGWVLGVLPGIGSAMANIGQSVSDNFQDFLLATGQTISDLFGLITLPVRATIGASIGVLGALINTSVGAFQALLVGGISGWFDYIINTTRTLLAGIQSKISGVMDRIRSIPGLGDLFPASDGLANSQLTTPAPTLAVGSRYMGQIGWAAGGFLGDLLGAAQQEMQRMPGGAQLMVANSSETILPQGTLGALVRSLSPTIALPAGGGSGGANVQVGDINIYGATGDPQAIAQAVIDAIQQRFEGEMQAQLS